MVTEYLLPGSADEAAAQREGAVLMAGGTTVMPAVLDGSLRETRVVGLARAGLDGISHEGGRTDHRRLRHARAAAGLGGAAGAAAEAVGGPALRNMATVGGNVVIGGDVACALLALDATVDLGSRTVPLVGALGRTRHGHRPLGVVQ